MHTIFTLSQVGDLGNTANKFSQIVKCFPYNTAAAKSTSPFHSDKIFHTTKDTKESGTSLLLRQTIFILNAC